MQSGIGDQGELRRFGIPVVQHLPGRGAKLSRPRSLWLRLGVFGSTAAAQQLERGNFLLEEPVWDR